MRKFAYNCQSSPDRPLEVSEAEILETYFPWWKEQMMKAHQGEHISEENCIQDWIVVYWAWEITNE